MSDTVRLDNWFYHKTHNVHGHLSKDNLQPAAWTRMDPWEWDNSFLNAPATVNMERRCDYRKH